MPRHPSILKTALILTTVVAMTTGCAGKTKEKHAEWVSAADQRWKSMRSGLLLNVAQQRFDSGDLDAAEKTLREAMEVDAANPGLHLLAGRVSIERGKLERAFGRISHAISLAPDMPSAHYFLGIVHQRWNQHEPALAAYRAAYDLQPDNLSYLLATAETYVALERSSEALELLTSRADYFAESVGLRAAIGQVHMMRNEFAQAVPWLRQASLMAPDDLTLQEDLATAQYASGDTLEAVRLLRRITSHPEFANRSDLLIALGRCHEKLGQWGQAELIYRKVTRENPSDGGAWIRLAEAAMAQNDLDTTAMAAHRAIKTAAHRPEGYLLLGLVWQQKGQPQRAAGLFEQASKIAPDDAAPLILQGLAMEKSGRRADAVAAYRQALSRQPEDERILQLLANASSDEETLPQP